MGRAPASVSDAYSSAEVSRRSRDGSVEEDGPATWPDAKPATKVRPGSPPPPSPLLPLPPLLFLSLLPLRRPSFHRQIPEIRPFGEAMAVSVLDESGKIEIPRDDCISWMRYWDEE